MYNYVDVINLHLTEKCNYSCKHCFAKFSTKDELDLKGWKEVVNKIENYFTSKKIKKGRINLAGGEPMVLNYLDDLIDYIHHKNIKVSIITNATMLSKDRIDKWVNKVDTIGISIDSLDKDTNILIGRHFKKKTLDYEWLVDMLNYIKSKGIQIKVNTVVTKINLNQDIQQLYRDIEFDRIKILQVRINKNANTNAQNLSISSDEFKKYYKDIDEKNIVIETDEDFDSSYVFIDPKGYLISNANHIHNKIGLVIDQSLEDLINKAKINYHIYNKRYKRYEGEKA